MPIGQTPGHLSRAMSLLDNSALIVHHSTEEFDRCLVNVAIESQSLRLWLPKHSSASRQWDESQPQGPALPQIL